MKEKKCSNTDCKNTFVQYNSLQKYCSYGCKKACSKVSAKRSKPIKKLSGKRKSQVAKYHKQRIIFLEKPENKYCEIRGEGCTNIATTIEHSAGRSGEMLLNEKYWKAACLSCNLELENNPELSRKHQLSKIHLGKKM